MQKSYPGPYILSRNRPLPHPRLLRLTHWVALVVAPVVGFFRSKHSEKFKIFWINQTIWLSWNLKRPDLVCKYIIFQNKEHITKNQTCWLFDEEWMKLCATRCYPPSISDPHQREASIDIYEHVPSISCINHARSIPTLGDLVGFWKKPFSLSRKPNGWEEWKKWESFLKP